MAAGVMFVATCFRLTGLWQEMALISEQGWITVILACLGMFGLQRYGDKTIEASYDQSTNKV